MAFDSNIKGYMTFGKSFSRGAAFPLEAYEIWTDYDALVAYAANTDPNKDPSYIGQKVAYIDKENNKVTHYGIEIDGTLKELGASPIGDEKSIVIGENNTISLKGVSGLVFERDIIGEDGEPTGQKENVQFQPLMTKDGLIWVEPSKTTVEGLAALIDGLTARVSALENDRVTEEELADAIAEVEAKIPTVPTDVSAFNNDAGYLVASDVANKAEKADTLEGYGITDAYTKTEVDTELAKKAAQTDFEALKDRVDTFFEGTGAADVIDTLEDLVNYINTHEEVDIPAITADIQALEDKLVGIDTTVVAYVTAAIEALKIGDYAKAADLTALAGRVEALEGKPFETYATKDEVNAKVSTETYNTDKETFALKDAVAGTYATKAELEPVTQTANNAATKADNLETRINDIVATGGEPNAINTIKVNGTALAIDDQKAVDITVPTALAQLTGYTELNALAQKGVDDAKTANDAIATLTGAGGRIAGIEADVSNLKTTTSGHGTTIADHETRVAAIETSIADGGAVDLRFDALEGFKESQTQINKDLNTAITTTLPEAINKKLDASEIAKYSTTEAMNAAIEAATKDKLVASDLADYAKTADVANTYATLTALNESNALLANEISRATAAEKALSDSLALLIENPTEDLDSVKEIIAHVKEQGTEVAGIITRLDGHDSLLAGIGGTDQPATVIAAINEAVASLEPLAIATADKLGGVKSAADVVDGENTITAVNKVYVDATSAVGEVKAISTDILVNGVEELILFGGNAGANA